MQGGCICLRSIFGKDNDNVSEEHDYFSKNTNKIKIRRVLNR